jgi:ribose transport system substrate-binding protein
MRNNIDEKLERGLVQSVLRACQLLHVFRSPNEVLTLRDFTDRTGLPRTTAFRILRTLQQGGLLEVTGFGAYRRATAGLAQRPIRIGYAAGSDSAFSQVLTAGLERACAKLNAEFIAVNNRFSPKAAVKNAELLVARRVDVAVEHQGFETVAASVAAIFRDAGIPMIAIEVPHPNAIFFGPDNYRMGLRSGKALARWARAHWNVSIEEILLLHLPHTGMVPQLRTTGILDGVAAELPSARNTPTVRLECSIYFDRNLEVLRKYLRRRHVKPTLVGAFNDVCALAAIRAFEEAGGASSCAVVSHAGIREARDELRRPGTRLIGTVAFYPERWGEELIPLAQQLRDGKQVPETNFISAHLLTPQNVDLYYPMDRKTASEGGP